MHFVFVHLPAAATDDTARAVDAALAGADTMLLAGVRDRVMEGTLTDGRSWLASFDDETCAQASAVSLGAALVGAPEAAALAIEGAGVPLSPDETAWLVANHTVVDAARFKPYVAAVADVTARHGGRFLARAGRTVRIAGTIEAGRSVILAFADRAAAERFYAAPDYAPLLALRLATTRPNMLLAPAA